MNNLQLSKAVSHALRHEPWLYELELDDEGWVSVEELLSSLRSEKLEWLDLSEVDLVEMITRSDKKRHELQNGKIRALYGHSLPDKLLKTPAEPPEVLYHGTSPDTMVLIQKSGLQPMNRQYVHLSVDTGTAKQVGCRKARTPVLLEVQAKVAAASGVAFYRGNDLVWLADQIPAQFIVFPS
ncbi:RNA 2'-phosphotransferase [Chitinimonas sp. PSY-7]|uniref:RNA 2'-phosphotransferase n=1 Tax=Chitinimonas sp. PSY-7 TaxID=3459088 RepID=UPI004040199A